jgi:hypothetical protein
MARNDYLPGTDGEQLIWLGNFARKLNSIGATVGVTPEQAEQFEIVRANFQSNLDTVATKKSDYRSAVTRKDEQKVAMLKLIRDTVGRVKHHENYTTALGDELGIVAPETPGIPGGGADAKPEFVATQLADRIRLDWIKSIYDSVIVQCKRGSETTFTLLGADMISPFEDLRQNINVAVPEVRIYRMRYAMKDIEIGQWSDEVRVACMVDASA